MSTELHLRTRELFDQAMDRPEAERRAFLLSACGDDQALFDAVERLLQARAAAGSFLSVTERRADRIGRYLIRGELGRGAMGVVYDAIDPMIGRNVAVKVINLKAVTEPGKAQFMTGMLFREARSAGQLFHPNIVIIFDVGQEDDSAFIAMEKVDGPSLHQVLASGRVLQMGEKLRLLQQTAAALDYAHQQGVIHRDIKPANIVLQNGTVVKVADFGIAKVTSTQTTTMANVVIGTPGYMSPEQIEARPVDGRSDQFSLAVLAYELLTGALPFQAESVATLAHLIVYGQRPSARVANPALPPEVDAVFQRGLGRFAEERFESCGALVAALEAVLKQVLVERPTLKLPDLPTRIAPARKRRAALPSVVVSGVVAVVLLCALVFYKQDELRAFFQHSVLERVVSGSPPTPAATPVAARAGDPPILVPKVVPVPSKAPARQENAASAGPTREAKPKPVSAEERARESYEAATEKRREGQMEDAMALLGQAAALGDVNAMTELAEGYHDGDGAEQNQGEALRWYRRAAEAGSSSAMVLLGAMYFLEDVPGASDEEAARWFQKATDKGNPAAMYNLATMYETGRGVAKDPGQALDLFRRAAALGNSEAQRRLSELQAR
jgi:serine/threonine protein kinase